MGKESLFTRPVLLQNFHIVEGFDCGDEALDSYLKKYALANNQNGSAITYVTAKGSRVVGYYTLAPASVSKSDVPQRVGKGLANHPVPVVLLARLAVDRTEKGIGLGKGLLRDVFRRIIPAVDIIGARALFVQAKNKQAKSFYEHFGFESSPIDQFHLYLLLKDIKKTLGI